MLGFRFWRVVWVGFEVWVGLGGFVSKGLLCVWDLRGLEPTRNPTSENLTLEFKGYVA